MELSGASVLDTVDGCTWTTGEPDTVCSSKDNSPVCVDDNDAHYVEAVLFYQKQTDSGAGKSSKPEDGWIVDTYQVR